jgi:hypothetical protein
VEYRLLVLVLRLLVAGFAAVILGVALWFIGSINVIPLFPNNGVAVTANLVVSVGIGAGVAGWLIGLRVASDRLPRRFDLPATVAVAIICAWLGQVFLGDLLFKNAVLIRAKTAGEVYGAVIGGAIGALIVPLIIGAWRVAHRQEP